MSSAEDNEIEPLQEQLEILAAERERLLERLTETEQLRSSERQRLRSTEQALRRQSARAARVNERLDALESSRELAFGRALVASTRSARSTLRLPSALGRARRLTPAPNDSIDTAHRRTKLNKGKPRTAGLRKAEATRIREVGERLASRLAAGEDLRVAGVVDDFTRNDLSLECDFLDLHPEHWEGQLERHAPHLVFIESAWRGLDDSWYGAVANPSPELLDLLEWCREHGIATVFWAKEDPLHMHSFLRVAHECDFTFTTDVDCIGRYKKILGHDRVSLLPFANQPQAHNPIESHERNPGIVFAGSYYRRFPERTKALESIFRAARDDFDFDIYDRNFGLDRPEFAFPPEFLSRVKGSLPASEIDRAYKGYRFSLNLNSITLSQSMFARRVYELMASNTLVVSNYSRGMVNFFGDLLVASDSGDECVEWMRELASDQLRADQIRLAALRKVMREHTYADRLAYILARVTGRDFETFTPQVTVVAAPASPDDLESVLHSVARQRGVRCHLVLVGDHSPSQDRLPEGVSVAQVTDNEVVELTDLAAPGSQAIAFFDGADWYGENYLLDAALTWRYRPELDVVGKQRFSRLGRKGVDDVPGASYAPVTSLAVRRSLVSPDSAVRRPDGGLATWIRDGQFTSPSMLSIDRLNYLEGGARAPDDALEKVRDADVDAGLSMDELYEAAETTRRSPRTRETPGDITGKSLHSATERRRKRTRLKVRGIRDGLEIESALRPGAEELIHLTTRLGVLTHWPSGIATLHLEASSGADLRLLVTFVDHEGNTVATRTLRSNRDVELSIPAGTVELELAIKVTGPGVAAVHGILLRENPVRPSHHLTRARTLVIADQYPSYERLYSNGFVHSRVKAYRKRGERVEVFTPRPLRGRFTAFDGSEVVSGSTAELRRILRSGAYTSIGVHFLDPPMWRVLKEFANEINITVWIHGAEIQPWWRRAYNAATPEEFENLKAKSERRQEFWRAVLDDLPARVRFVIVSRYFADEIEQDLGQQFPDGTVSIIHNPIDTELFTYVEKPVEQRKRVLSIRPFASAKYANDLSVAAILELSDEPWFDELQFLIVGNGPLFGELTAPLHDLPNVELRQGFLTQQEIAATHRDFGVFLVPTRMDAQGVSRDEAMSSGLVPITNAVAAIPEFVDEDSGILAPEEDSRGLAEGIRKLYQDPELFRTLSSAAAARVRSQSGLEAVIDAELDLLNREQPAD